MCSVDSLVQFKIHKDRCVCWCMARVSTLGKWKQEDGAVAGYIVSLRTSLSQTKHIMYVCIYVLYAVYVSIHHIHMQHIKQMIQGEYEQVVLFRA